MSITTQTDIAEETIQFLPIDSIQPDPNQPRKVFNEENLARLATNMRAQKVIQPITVRIDKNNNVIIKDGERRWRAGKLAELSNMPVRIETQKEDSVERLVRQISANQHEQMKALEMAQFFDDLVTIHHMKIGTIPQLLKHNGLEPMERSYISNLRRLLTLPDWAKDMINSGELSASHGKYLLQAEPDLLDDIKTKLLATMEKWERGVTVRDLNNIIHRIYHDTYRDISNRFDHNAPLFPTTDCDDCKTCRRMQSLVSSVDNIYCLDEACYEGKQTEARAAIKTNKSAEKAAANEPTEHHQEPEAPAIKSPTEKAEDITVPDAVKRNLKNLEDYTAAEDIQQGIVKTAATAQQTAPEVQADPIDETCPECHGEQMLYFSTAINDYPAPCKSCNP